MDLGIDYVVVSSEKYFSDIAKEAEQLGFDRERIIPIRVFAIPGFDFCEYVKLINSNISIMANNCWGGVTYNYLAMKFKSPLINMLEWDEDYLKLLSDLKYYFGLTLQFDRWRYGYNGDINVPFPTCRLGDILLHFNHYKSMEEVEAKWYDRIKRINYDNLFIMMYTENKDILEAFDKLPYDKKICFVPFSSQCKSAFTLEVANKKRDVPFWKIVNEMGYGSYNDYNVIELLNSGMVNHKRIKE